MKQEMKFVVAATAIFLFITTLSFLYVEYGTTHPNFSTMLHESQQSEYDAERADYAEAMADHYGGATPEDALYLYVTAVKEGDYKLASRYFIKDKQGEELANLEEASTKYLAAYIELLKRPMSKECDADQCILKVALDGPDYLMRFKRYPNNLWKIVEL